MKGLIKRPGLGGGRAPHDTTTNQPKQNQTLKKKNSKYLDHDDIAMKKTTLLVFMKHIWTTHCKTECCLGYCPRIIPPHLWWRSVEMLFSKQRKKISKINTLTTTAFSTRTMECNPCVEVEKIPATSRKLPVLGGGGKRDLIRTCYECRVLFRLWTSVISA